MKLAERSICLLKNDHHLLPFTAKPKPGPTATSPQGAKKKMVLVFGDEATVAGHGSGGVVMPFVSLVSEELAKLYPADEVEVSHPMIDGKAVCDPAAAAALAEAADLVVVVVRAQTGEGMDRKNLTLVGSVGTTGGGWSGNNSASYDQDKLVAAIAEQSGVKTVVLARCSGAFTMPWLGQVASVLYQLMPGQAGGVAAAKAIAGRVNPQGKLPVSFPTSIDETWLGTPLNPAQYPGVTKAQSAALAAGEPLARQMIEGGASEYKCVNNNSDTSEWQRCDYSVEGMHVGYRWYATAEGAKHPPLLPFGHGLSYTTWAYSELKASATSVSFTLENSGAVAGTEVSQVYLKFPPSVGEPPLQLKGFAKTALVPGAKATVTVPLTEREVSVYSVAAHAWVGAKGAFGVEVGSSSADLRLHGTFTL